MTSEANPVLPWGNSSNEMDNVDLDVPATLGLALGAARIEVKWTISSEDESGHEESHDTVGASIFMPSQFLNFPPSSEASSAGLLSSTIWLLFI